MMRQALQGTLCRNRISLTLLLLHLACCGLVACFSNSAAAATPAATSNCQQIELSAQTALSLPLVATDNDNAPVHLQATDIQYPLTGQACLILQNPTNRLLRFALYLQSPRAHHVELFERVGADNVLLGVAGLDYPLYNWQKFGGEILFFVDAPAGSTKQYKLNIASSGMYNSKLQVMPADRALEKLNSRVMITLILAGMILMVTFYTLFLALSSHDTTYFLLAGTCAFTALLQFGDLGVLYPLWPDAVYWNGICPMFFSVCSTIFGTFLARSYLLTATTMPKNDKALRLYALYMALVALPLSLTREYTLQILFYGVPAIAMIFWAICLSVIRIRQGYSPARIFFIASFLPNIFGIIMFLGHIAILPDSPLISLVPVTGTALQLLVYALALGERINWLQEQHEIAGEEALIARTQTNAKKNFLAHISHELRTPLAGIIGLAELARKNPLYETNQSLIDGLDESAQHLLETTNLLLDHARIDAGKWNMCREDFSVQVLLDSLVRKYRVIALRKQLSIVSQIRGNLPEQINGEADIIRRILEQIIDNAIKFTRDGGIMITAEALRKPEDRVVVRFDVIDTGRGIGEDFRPRIFELFELADHSTTRERQGLGLGLSLCKKFCDLLGGEIHCESNNNGSVFWFTAPCDYVTPDARPRRTTDTAPAAAIQQPEQRRWLVAEDDDTLQMIIGSHLEKLQVDHALFPNGKPLVDEYRQDHRNVSCVLLDWNMPVCNASQAIAAIREFEQANQLPPVPIVIMSAYDRHSARELQLPADIRVLQKPVTIDDIAHLLYPKAHASTHPGNT